ncbi:DUF4160 domain-containing protein [Leptonema illini]|uniref:DUF4160 domain-containing protein n=1 Tax=Leptonema illini TaxID=183 RepID=UPI000990C287|nr:DUF4160 domain-containing protein [Leptonema illini]
MHIHVRKAGNVAKFWVRPAVTLASNSGFSSMELRWIGEQVAENASLIEEKWHEFFRG